MPNKILMMAAIIVSLPMMSIVGMQSVKALTPEDAHKVDVLADLMKVNLRNCDFLLNTHEKIDESMRTETLSGTCDKDVSQMRDWCDLKDDNGLGFRFRQSFPCDDPRLSNYINARGV